MILTSGKRSDNKALLIFLNKCLKLKILFSPQFPGMQLKPGIRLRWETPKTEKTAAIQLGLSHFYYAMCGNYPSCRALRPILTKMGK